jgi:hypothetical protein
MTAEVLAARALLSQMMEAERAYLQTIRWQPEMWVERHLSAARLKLYELLLRHVPSDALFTDEEDCETSLFDEIDAYAWLVVWTGRTATENDIQVVLAKFPRPFTFAVLPALQDEHL